MEVPCKHRNGHELNYIYIYTHTHTHNNNNNNNKPHIYLKMGLVVVNDFVGKLKYSYRSRRKLTWVQ